MKRRFPISDIAPAVFFEGRFRPTKAVRGEEIAISASVTREGHDALGVQVVLLDAAGTEVERVLARQIWSGTDRYEARVRIPDLGMWNFHIEAFDDPFHTWEHDAGIKIEAEIDAQLCCEMGIEIFQQAIASGEYGSKEAKVLLQAIKDLGNSKAQPKDRYDLATSDEIRAIFFKRPTRRLVTVSESYQIFAEREHALFGAWYEFFPRSEGAQKNQAGEIISGTFKSAEKSLARVAKMGFEILYLPPIHPIGNSYRKGKNNSLTTVSSDPGVPWAIGAATGGHDAVDPELGTLSDFDDFVSAAQKHKLEIAMDFALQVSPDHPWVKSNPEWFTARPDGSIAYAENPPKKYQDIFPINFDNDYAGIRDESIRILNFWISRGIKIFRVDNPHTKPVAFWEEVISIVNTKHPEVIFLAEAFTRPTMMHALGKAGFQQSYTYFTWRTTKSELIDYSSEISKGTSAFFRPNLWVNTPDILPFHLQSGNPAIFAQRALLAATLSPSWGMYAGYELFEHLPIKSGTEEYLDSEKYEIKIREWALAEKNGLSLSPFISELNKIRRENIAFSQLRNLEFHHTDSDQIIAYSKRMGENLMLVVVNLDSTKAQETTIHWNLPALGIDEEHFKVDELLIGEALDWSAHTFVRLDPTRPKGQVGHIARVRL